VYALGFFVYTDFLSYSQVSFFVSFVLILICVLLYVKNEWLGVQLLLYLLLLSPDHPRDLIENIEILKSEAQISYYSFITTKILGISTSVWSIVCISFIAILSLIRAETFRVIVQFRLFFIFILISFFVTLLSTTLDLNSRDMIDLKLSLSDARLFIVLFVVYFIALRFCLNYKDKAIDLFVQAMLNIAVICGLKTVLFLLFDILGGSPKLMLATQPYVFIPLVFAVLLSEIRFNFVLIGLIILASVKISRGEIAYMIVEILLFVLMTFLLKGRNINSLVKHYFRGVSTFGFFVVVPIILMAFYNEYLFNFLVYKFRFFSSELWSGEVAMSASTRMYEFLNILEYQFEHIRALLIGRGFGGYFDFSYVRLPYELGVSDYSEKELSYGVFFKPHFFINFTLLKAGIFGFAGYVVLCGAIFVSGLANAKKGSGYSKFLGLYGVFLFVYSLNMFWLPIQMFICVFVLMLLMNENSRRKNEKRISY